MPGLYRVVDGVDVFDPKFNIVSPGADPDVYFPWSETERRLIGPAAPSWRRWSSATAAARPRAAASPSPDKPLLFTMARLDRIKNLTGLVDWYGSSPAAARRRRTCSSSVGTSTPDDSNDAEEREQIERMHELIDQHDLEGAAALGRVPDRAARWWASSTASWPTAAGCSCQPALFEAYGLTVIEAMSSGLPVFATCYGGPQRDPRARGLGLPHRPATTATQAAELMADLFERFAAETPEAWDAAQPGHAERVIESGYTWELLRASG